MKRSNESRCVKNPVVPNPGPYTKTPDDATKKRQNTRHYCQTHGACNHSSNKCIFKAEGYQDSAMKNNKMGGSKAYCN